jgi:hypothetical protein
LVAFLKLQEETMKRMVTAFLALALNTIPAYAQIATPQSGTTGCTITEATAPGVRGVRLGMSVDQVLALFPSSNRRREMKEAIDRARAASEGETVYLVFDPATDARAGSFDDVSGVAVGLNRGRVTDFSIIYVGPSWRSVDEWIGKLAESLKLPGARSWTVGPNETPNKVLRCKGVEIEAAIQGGGASIRVRNTDKLQREGTASEEARRRRDFKP